MMQKKAIIKYLLGSLVLVTLIGLGLSKIYLKSNTTEHKETLEENKCTSKKFTNQYSFVYDTFDSYKSKGNDNFNDITDTVDDSIFSYDCEEIKDECGNTWYGVVFYKWSSEKGEYKFYY